jgi:hypothetical protein
MKDRKHGRLEVASWVAGIVAAVIALIALIVDLHPKSGENDVRKDASGRTAPAPAAVPSPVGTASTPLPVRPAPTPVKGCSGDKTVIFSPSDPGVMQTGPDGRRIDLGDGGGGTRLQKWEFHWIAPAKVTSVKCSGQRNEHVLAENKDGSSAECDGSINGGNDPLAMHVTWDGPCDQQ